MTTLSCERKYSRTAFFSHSLTTQRPSFGSATRAPAVQQLNALINRRSHMGREIFGGQLGPALKCGVNEGLELGTVGHVYPLIRERMRSAASTHCATGGTREIRRRPAPGLTPAAARAR